MNTPEITIIPATPRVAQGGKLRACAYGRVSTGEESQATSYATQKQFYTEFINKQPDMEFAGFYGDEAISGTNRSKRVQFNRMIEDAKAHRFDVIYTKSISRFARNTLDTLKCVRELQKLNPPVEVIFEKESLRTLEAQSELVLTIMSALAQDESRSISENIRWSLQKKFQNGEDMVNLDFMLGYDRGEDGAWVINEEQAKIVRYIYASYAAGMSATQIAKDLNAKGIKTVRGNEWRADAIMLILRNEKYSGSIILQKTYTKSFLDHKAVKNRGEVQQVRIDKHHPAIVGDELLRAVEDRLGGKKVRKDKRKHLNSKEQPVFCKMTMGEDEEVGFSRLTYRADLGDASFQYPVWKTKNLAKIPELGKTYLCEIAIEQSFMEMLYRLKKEYEDEGNECWLWKTAMSIIEGLTTDDAAEQKLRMLEEEIERTDRVRKETMEKERQLFQTSATSGIYAGLVADLEKKLERLREQLGELEMQNDARRAKAELDQFMDMLLHLPTTNAAGVKLMVNTMDTDGSLIVTADGKPKDGKLTQIRGGNYKITPERINEAPDLLPFDRRIYDSFIMAAKVLGDEIEYSTTFGLKLRSKGNSRTLRSFFGFKRVEEDGRVEYLDTTWKVNGRAVTPKKEKKEKGK